MRATGPPPPHTLQSSTPAAPLPLGLSAWCSTECGTVALIVRCCCCVWILQPAPNLGVPCCNLFGTIVMSSSPPFLCYFATQVIILILTIVSAYFSLSSLGVVFDRLSQLLVPHPSHPPFVRPTSPLSRSKYMLLVYIVPSSTLGVGSQKACFRASWGPPFHQQELTSNWRQSPARSLTVQRIFPAFPHLTLYRMGL